MGRERKRLKKENHRDDKRDNVCCEDGVCSKR